MTQQNSYTGMPFEEFIHPEFGKLNIVIIDNEPWLIATEVCKILAFDTNNVTSIIQTHVDKSDRRVMVLPRARGSATLNVNTTIINEAGLYDLISAVPSGSRKAKKGTTLTSKQKARQERFDAARSFKRWVTHEVLPSIRKTGFYAASPVKTWANMNEDEREFYRKRAITMMQRAYEDLDNIIDYAQFGYDIASRTGFITVSDFAKVMADEFKIGRNRMYKFLRDEGYLLDMKGADKWNKPRQTELETHRMTIHPVPCKGGVVYLLPLITEKGFKYYHDRFILVTSRNKPRNFDVKMINADAVTSVNDGFYHLRPTAVFYDRLNRYRGIT